MLGTCTIGGTHAQPQDARRLSLGLGALQRELKVVLEGGRVAAEPVILGHGYVDRAAIAVGSVASPLQSLADQFRVVHPLERHLGVASHRRH